MVGIKILDNEISLYSYLRNKNFLGDLYKLFIRSIKNKIMCAVKNDNDKHKIFK